MPALRSAASTGSTSLAASTKSPVIAALPPPVGWKLTAVASAHGRWHRHPVIDDRIAARDAELQHAANGIALAAEHLLDLLDVKIGFRRLPVRLAPQAACG